MWLLERCSRIEFHAVIKDVFTCRAYFLRCRRSRSVSSFLCTRHSSAHTQQASPTPRCEVSLRRVAGVIGASPRCDVRRVVVKLLGCSGVSAAACTAVSNSDSPHAQTHTSHRDTARDTCDARNVPRPRGGPAGRAGWVCSAADAGDTPSTTQSRRVSPVQPPHPRSVTPQNDPLSSRHTAARRMGPPEGAPRRSVSLLRLMRDRTQTITRPRRARRRPASAADA